MKAQKLRFKADYKNINILKQLFSRRGSREKLKWGMKSGHLEMTFKFIADSAKALTMKSLNIVSP